MWWPVGANVVTLGIVIVARSHRGAGIGRIIMEAALDRIGEDLLEASRDLGASPFWTFTRVTLPLSRQGILAGTVLIMLPMFGDYYTPNLLSGSPRTRMIGNEIDQFISSGVGGTEGAALTVVLCHGFALDLRMWFYQRRDLPELVGDGLSVVCYDHRSHGRSGHSSRRSSTGMRASTTSSTTTRPWRSTRACPTSSTCSALSSCAGTPASPAGSSASS